MPQIPISKMPKQPRAVKGSTAEPPAGYHYKGQAAQITDWKLTLRLRRDVEGLVLLIVIAGKSKSYSNLHILISKRVVLSRAVCIHIIANRLYS
jgi:hypothetical protein